MKTLEDIETVLGDWLTDYTEEVFEEEPEVDEARGLLNEVIEAGEHTPVLTHVGKLKLHQAAGLLIQAMKKPGDHGHGLEDLQYCVASLHALLAPVKLIPVTTEETVSKTKPVLNPTFVPTMDAMLHWKLKQLIAEGLTFAGCVQTFALKQVEEEPHLNVYWQNADSMPCVHEGDCEIDTQGIMGSTIVSEGSDPGAYVLAWVWVDNETAGVVDSDLEDPEDPYWEED